MSFSFVENTFEVKRRARGQGTDLNISWLGRIEGERVDFKCITEHLQLGVFFLSKLHFHATEILKIPIVFCEVEKKGKIIRTLEFVSSSINKKNNNNENSEEMKDEEEINIEPTDRTNRYYVPNLK